MVVAGGGEGASAFADGPVLMKNAFVELFALLQGGVAAPDDVARFLQVLRPLAFREGRRGDRRGSAAGQRWCPRAGGRCSPDDLRPA
jgi:hypothetical protein